MTQPLISIIIPCRNAGDYLLACLESIARQTIDNYECIVVDDGSSDQSREVVQYYALDDERFISIDNSGAGIIEALRSGSRISSGQYITRMDADDIMLPRKLELLLHVCERGTVATGQVEYFASGKSLGMGYTSYAEWLNTNMNAAQPWQDIYRECVVPSPAWMLHRSDFESIGAFGSDRYPEDYDLCFRMYAAGLQIASTSQVVHQWRDYDNRTSRTDEHYSDNRFLDIKIDYFLRLDYSTSDRLVLWGAGRKGKAIAKRLINLDLSFKWVTDNPKKVGHNIYGQILSNSTAVDDRDHCIMAVASRSGVAEIIISDNYQRLDKTRRWWFC
jgi:glycosyltransferase involved in cell wall biosynthesis